MHEWFGRNRWWLVRVIQLPIDILVFATLAFFFVRLMPGDPVMAIVGQSGAEYSDEDIAILRDQMGLGGTLLDQLFAFWAGLFRLDLGTSIASGAPVTQEVWSRLPSTMELVGLGMFGALIFAFLLGFLYLRIDTRAVRSAIRGYASLATSIPVFVIGVFGIVLFFVAVQLAPPPVGRVWTGGVVPTVTGFPLIDEVITGNWLLFASNLAHYVLPVGAIVLTYTPNLLVQLLGGLDREVEQTTTRFQIASGASRGWIYFSIFRRSLASVVVVFGQLFGMLLGGAVTLEQLFGLGGAGQLATRSVASVDFPALQGFLILVAVVCLVVYFLVDLVNMWLDPRRRPGVSTEDN